MKIIVIDKSGELYVMPDTVLLRNDDPYYTPNFATTEGEDIVEGITIKVTRLVKSIAERFAHRAWGEWCVSRDHRLCGVHHTIGRCFDRSFEVDPLWHTKEELSEEECQMIDKQIALISEFIQLRIGDYVFIER